MDEDKLAKMPLQTGVVTARAEDTMVRCRYCRQYGNQDALFRPCECDAIHRECFCKWRQGWINPRNYFSCPDCMRSYRIERVRESSAESKERIRSRYRVKVFTLWLGTLGFFCGFIGAVASLAYLCDRSEKNIPVALKYMLTSVVSGFPDKNSTTLWMEDFKKPNVAVWPYYTLFATFVSSICILVAFTCIGCTFDETERRRRRPCCEDCCSDAGVCYCYCYDPCPHNNCCCLGDDSDDCDCKDCNCKGGCGGGGGGGGGGEAFIIIFLVIAVVVIISAVFVVIFYAVKKWTLLYDRMTDMLLQQQAELEGDTVVLAMNETWRPMNEV